MKRCQACKEPIRRWARVCPWCLSEQKSLIRDALNVVALFIFLLIAAAIGKHLGR